eukprot:6190181-Pleurochrysis_carterae.AAC.4
MQTTRLLSTLQSFSRATSCKDCGRISASSQTIRIERSYQAPEGRQIDSSSEGVDLSCSPRALNARAPPGAKARLEVPLPPAQQSAPQAEAEPRVSQLRAWQRGGRGREPADPHNDEPINLVKVCLANNSSCVAACAGHAEGVNLPENVRACEVLG